MTSRFVLRGEDTQDNPFAARLYGKGLTQGRTVFYENIPTSASASRTKFLAILAQGARFRGDYGCSQAIKVYYAGFELPETDSGGRNWRFHKGTVSGAPDYKPVQAVNTTNNTFQSNGHGLVTGDLVAFHGRGSDVVVPAAAVGVIGTHTQWMVWRVDDNYFKLLRQTTGTPLEANQFDLTNTGANLSRLFFWKGANWLFDANQGRPEFFPTLDFTFSGLSYIEVYLPEYLSTGEDEPTNLKVIMMGKELRQISNVGGIVAFTGAITDQPNNALVSIDTLHFDAKLALSRFGGASFVAYRDRCDEYIGWTAGNNAPAYPGTMPTLSNMTYDPATGVLTAGSGGVVAQAFSPHFTTANPSIEFTYTGGIKAVMFTNNNTVSPYSFAQQGVQVENGTLEYVTGSTVYPILTIPVGSRVKVAYESGVLNIYYNSVLMPFVHSSQGTATYGASYYMKFVINETDTTISNILASPSGSEVLPRQIPRFEGHLGIADALPAIDVFNAMVHMSPGCDWADIDGRIEMAVNPDRTPCFTFRIDPDNYDPDNPATHANCAKVSIKRRSLESTPNFYRFTFRDTDDPILKRKPVFIDRKAKRALLSGRLIDSGLIPYGPMLQSQMERIGETRARLEADLDIGFTVEAFADSLVVVKGSFVNLIAPEAAYTGTPALCKVLDVRYSDSDVETLIYDLTIIKPDYYSDTEHGPLTP
jgi:hypothetical protein